MTSDLLIRKFQAGDAAAVSALICRNFREVNIRDYPADEMERMSGFYSPEKVAEIAGQSHFYVACMSDVVVGCAAVAGCQGREGDCLLQTIFVNPDYQGCGIGRRLVDVLEQDEVFCRAERAELHASITACEFYQKLGYGYAGGEKVTDEHGLYLMVKELEQT